MQRKRRQPLSRRRVLQLGATGLLGSTFGLLDALALAPRRVAEAEPNQLPSIQFDIGDYVPPAEEMDGTLFRFGPVFTLFITLRLTRKPTVADQQVLERALSTIEERYDF